MRRLSSLGSKQLAHRKGRSVLTAGGIILGVAVLFGVLVSNATTQTGVDRLISDFVGDADVLAGPPGAFDATVPESIVPRLAALPGVRVAIGDYRFAGSFKTPAVADPVQVEVIGSDLAAARRLQTFTLARGDFYRDGATEAIVPQRLLDRLGLKAGTMMPLGTPRGIQQVRIAGVLEDTGAGRTNQGDVVFTSLATARALMDAGPVVSGARLALDDGIDVEKWIETNGESAGSEIRFENASTVAQGFRDFLDILGAVFTFFAGIVLFVGAFLIYLTLSMAVIERVRVYGTMRALGATRGQIRRVVIVEALVLGTVSTAGGLVLGLALAKGLVALVSNLFRIDLPGLTVTRSTLVTAVIVGILTTLVSSLVPARRAGHLSPVVAMRGNYAAETHLSRAWIFGLLATAAGVGIGLTGGGAGPAGSPLLLLGAVLLTPLLLRPLARVLGRLTNRIARGVGDVAVLHLVKERSRSAYTLALIMVVMAMIFSIGGLYTTMDRAMQEAIDRQFGADLFLHPTGDRPTGTLAPSFEKDLDGIKGIGDFTPIRFAQVQFVDPDTGKPADGFARILDPRTYFDVAGFSLAEGTERGAREALERGGSILAPSSGVYGVQEGGLHVGSSVHLQTTQGVKEFRVAGTYLTIGGIPAITVGIADGRRYFNAGDPNSYLANLAPEANLEAVRAQIDRTLAARYNVAVDTAAETKQDAKEQFGRFFNIFYAILGVAAIVGLLGLANTLAMSVLQRYREIGVLRAIGATRSQIWRMVLVESATLGLVAFVLSLPLGLVMSLLAVRGVADAFSFDIAYVYPSGWIPVVGVFGVIMAVVAAVAPGRRAARLEVVSALQFE